MNIQIDMHETNIAVDLVAESETAVYGIRVCRSNNAVIFHRNWNIVDKLPVTPYTKKLMEAYEAYKNDIASMIEYNKAGDKVNYSAIWYKIKDSLKVF